MTEELRLAQVRRLGSPAVGFGGAVSLPCNLLPGSWLVPVFDFVVLRAAPAKEEVTALPHLHVLMLHHLRLLDRKWSLTRLDLYVHVEVHDVALAIIIHQIGALCTQFWWA